MASEQEMADLERMSGSYEPIAEGPLVGDQQSTQAIVAEYAQADPIYVHKTTALPSKYSHYRTLRGDGNCGWRALAFGYFEALLRIGDKLKILEELNKLKDYNTRLDATGLTPEVYEEFTGPTFALLRQTAANLPNHNGGAEILTAFNDPDISSQITYHFRLITSAWMKSHANFYADFLPDVDVGTYCRYNVEPFAVELENVGLQALATALIHEAGIAIEVLYLDRSPGEEINRHELSVLDAEGKIVESASKIRLLYRPGHYDLLYKADDIAQMERHAMANPEVRLITEYPTFVASDTDAYSNTEDLDILQMLPGYAMGHPPAFSTLPYHQPLSEQARPPTRLTPITKESLSPTSQGTSGTSPPPAEPPVEKFRTTMEQLEFDYGFIHDKKGLSAEPEQTGSAREDSPDMSKREDPAHYTNQAFQPQIWRPGRDYDRSSESGASRKGSS